MTRFTAAYNRIFGSGPAIALAGAGALLIGRGLARLTPELALPVPASLRLAGLVLALGLGSALIAWSVRTLTPERRGRALVTGGPFRFVRHPLYAAFLSILAPALILVLAHPAYLATLVLAHAGAHLVIGHEEALMAEWFPDSYPAYRRRTGRFVPRLTVFP